MTDQHDEFDSPWKDILETYFQDFMQFFFPQIHTDIDWSRGYGFLDQELRQVVRDAELGKRLVDKLVKVWKLTGEETWVLVHIEIQSQEESNRFEKSCGAVKQPFGFPSSNCWTMHPAGLSWKPVRIPLPLQSWRISKQRRLATTRLLARNGS
ncbi:MAG: hypothetical protein KME27_20145 [Lyngbya sp. HA4199-MV5]|jgi:hypothetical protein|nr:hypothetical protein [Lyngbya sp. HA4199-MV5]